MHALLEVVAAPGISKCCDGGTTNYKHIKLSFFAFSQKNGNAEKILKAMTLNGAF